jgi:YD repeat-containing protein
MNYSEFDQSDSRHGSYTVTSQQFSDGSSYIYSWSSFATAINSSPVEYQIAGGTFTNGAGKTASVRYGGYIRPNTPSDGRDPTIYISPGPIKIIDQSNRITLGNYCNITIPDPQAVTSSSPSGNCQLRNLKSWTDPEGNVRAFSYDGYKNIVQTEFTAKPSSTLPAIITKATFGCAAITACNRPLTTTDAKGNVTNYTYDPTHGGVLSETSPAPVAGGVRPQKRYTYGQFYAWIKNSAGTLVQAATPVWLLTGTSECKTLASCAGTADETKTTIAYGAAGTVNAVRPMSQTVASGNNSISATTSWTYDVQGNKLTEDGPLPGAADTTRWRYDLMRRVTGVVTPDPDGTGARKHSATRNTYDPAGLLIKTEMGTVNGLTDADWAAFLPLDSVQTAYDTQSRKAKVTTFAGGVAQNLTQYSYDIVGRPECTAVHMNPAVYASLPASACTLGTEGTEGPDRITKLTYNAANELIKTTVAVGTPDQADDETNTYTLNGKLASVTDGANNRTTFEYDGHDRLSKTRYPVPALNAALSSTTDYESVTYDANSNITQRRLRDGQLHNFTYDALNRMTAKDVPNIAYGELDTTYTYDLFGRQKTIANISGQTLASAYDGLGRMISETSYLGTKTLGYDAGGRMTSIIYPGATPLTVNYDYDVTGNVTAVRENNAATGAGVLATYAYDNLGRRTGITRGNGTGTTIARDGIGRLKSYTQDLAGTANDLTVSGPGAGGTAMTYNPASQLTGITRSNDAYAWTGHYNVNRTYGTNGLNQLTTAGALALTYDGRGNLNKSGTDNYGYTSENRMGDAPNATLLYDPMGRLSLVTPKSNTALQVRYDYYGDKRLTELNTANAIQRRYVYGPGTDEPLVWYEGAGLTDKRYLHTDERANLLSVPRDRGER